MGYAESENFTDWVHKGVAMKRNYASSSVTYRAVSHPKVLKTGGLVGYVLLRGKGGTTGMG